MTELLQVRLGDTVVGTLTRLPGDRTFFAFEQSYLEDSNRPVLSQSFFTRAGNPLRETRIYRAKLPPFFSNLLPEGHLREYLAARGGIKPNREFKLIELLGQDLPGAITVRPLQGAALSNSTMGGKMPPENQAYRFSLAGIQLKFSALAESSGGLTIPANGMGGDWIIKLPAQNFTHVPENEWAMLQLAKAVGIPIPEARLIDMHEIAGLPDLGILSGNRALAVKRFDRTGNGERIHIEDFAQVYGVFPAEKYGRVSYANMANLVWTLTGEQGLEDFIRRLTFSVVIGNGDMHLKNWSLMYPDGRTPQLTPAYDLISTIPYIPDDKLALSLSASKDMQAISCQHFKILASKAGIPEFITLKTVKDTVEAVRRHWNTSAYSDILPSEMNQRIDSHMKAQALF